MTGNVTRLPGVPEPEPDVPCKDVLENALQSGMTECIVIGTDGGGRFFLAASGSDLGRQLLLLERTKHMLLHHEGVLLPEGEFDPRDNAS